MGCSELEARLSARVDSDFPVLVRTGVFSLQAPLLSLQRVPERGPSYLSGRIFSGPAGLQTSPDNKPLLLLYPEMRPILSLLLHARLTNSPLPLGYAVPF